MTDRSLLLNAVIFYFILINIVTFIMYGIDKLKARSRGWRVSELALLLPAVLGGCWGAGMAMLLFRHKTKHWSFRIIVSLSLLVYMVITAVFLGMGLVKL